MKLDKALLQYIKGGYETFESKDPFMPGQRTVYVPEHYRYEHLCYVGMPVDPVRQSMNIYIPAAYLKGRGIGRYTAETAPYLLYLEGGGFRMQSTVEVTQRIRIQLALQRGYIVVSPNYRGCADHSIDFDGDGEPEFTGKAPAQLVDIKAAIRFLRHNADRLPGDLEHIFVTGGSSGGAMTALVGVSGNTDRFDAELKALCAAEGRDDVFACGDNFGPCDLYNCDMAYDWVYGRYIYETEPKVLKTMFDEKTIPAARMDEKGCPVLKADYAAGETAYTHYTSYAKDFVDKHIAERLHMTEGEYVASVMQYLLPAYREYCALHPEETQKDPFYFDSYEQYLSAGHGPDPYYNTELYPADGGYINFDLFRACISGIAFKGSPSFDLIRAEEMPDAENALFGTEKTNVVNFTQAGAAATGMELTPETLRKVRDYSATAYIGDGISTTAPHWYIRHGTVDNHIPLTQSFDLAKKLEQAGFDVWFELAYNVGHGEALDGPAEAVRFLDWCDSLTGEN